MSNSTELRLDVEQLTLETLRERELEFFPDDELEVHESSAREDEALHHRLRRR